MKTKYLAFAGIVSIIGIFYFFQLRNSGNRTKQTSAHKKAKAEKQEGVLALSAQSIANSICRDANSDQYGRDNRNLRIGVAVPDRRKTPHLGDSDHAPGTISVHCLGYGHFEFLRLYRLGTMTIVAPLVCRDAGRTRRMAAVYARKTKCAGCTVARQDVSVGNDRARRRR